MAYQVLLFFEKERYLKCDTIKQFLNSRNVLRNSCLNSYCKSLPKRNVFFKMIA